MRLVKFIDVNLLLLDEEEIGDHNDGNGSKHDGVRRHESKKVGSGSKDLPRDETPNTDRDSDELATLDVYVLWGEGGHVVGGGNGVGGDVGGDVTESPDEGGEEHGTSTTGRGVPKSLMRRQIFQGLVV